MSIKRRLITGLTLISVSAAAFAAPENYKFDMEGQHAFIQFKISHLGYSTLLGEFTDFDGSFTVDPAAPENSKVSLVINPKSVDSNHKKRDKHLRGKEFLNSKEFPQASFKSTKVEVTDKTTAKVHGELSLMGTKKLIVLDMKQMGAGKDPWGGFRRGFTGTTTLTLADFGIDYDLGPAKTVDIFVSIEGIRQE